MQLFHSVNNRDYLTICLDLAEKRDGLVFCPLLVSFARHQVLPHLWDYLREEKLRLDHLMLDSGAPTAASQGLHLDLDEYAQVINWTRDNPRVHQVTAVSLDVIPSDKSEAEKCAKASLNNFLRRASPTSLQAPKQGRHHHAQAEVSSEGGSR